MPHSAPPRHRAAVAPRRALAVSAAVVITALTISGAVGFGPGAAIGEPSRHGSAADSGAAGSAGSADGSSTADDSGAADPPKETWIVTDHGKPAKKLSSGTSTDDPSTTSKQKPPTRNPKALPAASGHGRRVVFDMGEQRVWLVRRDDAVARTYRVSGSRHADLLDPGSYSVYSKSEHAVSFDQKETMRYMVRFTHGNNAAIGFHDIPADVTTGDLVQSRSQLGTPLSAGCVRQWIKDARALWDFTDVGTRVVVTA